MRTLFYTTAIAMLAAKILFFHFLLLLFYNLLTHTYVHPENINLIKFPSNKNWNCRRCAFKFLPNIFGPFLKIHLN